MNHRKTIQAFPSLDIRNLFAGRSYDDPVLAATGIRFYASGRAALFHAVKSLHIPPGSIIMLPSFNCGVEVEAVLRAGYEVDFYRINNDLNIDVGHIAGKITAGTKGIVVPHYFGFPQDVTRLKELCSSMDITLMEDCAHALYSQNSNGKWLGTVGDLGLFSLRKTVYAPNGGAVLVNRKDSVIPDRGKRCFRPELLKMLAKSILENESGRDGITSGPSRWLLHTYRKYAIPSNISDGSGGTDNLRWYYDLPLFDYDKGMSAVSSFCAGKENFSDIVAARRKNYVALERILKKNFTNNFVFPKLPDGVCPLCFPLFVSQRDAVVSRMSARGVDPYVFGRCQHPMIDKKEFPELEALANTVIALPIHQQLIQEDMERVAEAFIRSSEGNL
jgi:perosamine synthetase